MHIVEPKVFIVGETQVNTEGMIAMLTELGVPEWTTDATSGSEYIMEVAGKLCYMSFSTDLNKNLTKVGTRNNFDYLQQGIISTKHGSVLEHGVVNIVFTNVSRVFTHELVRHRAGASYSQTSGRYVRTDELGFWIPEVIAEDANLEYLFRLGVEQQEAIVARMVEQSGINEMTDFTKKKKLTSAFRRIIGNGVANHIEATYNHRALRFLLVQRTSRHAEEEIRNLFNQLADQLVGKYPALYADIQYEFVDGYNEITFQHEKV